MKIVQSGCESEDRGKKKNDGEEPSFFFLSGRQDSNLRPPGPKPGALPACATPRALLRFSPRLAFGIAGKKPAVRAGFEPAIRINYVCQFSKLVDSASLPPHRITAFFLFPYF